MDGKSRTALRVQGGGRMGEAGSYPSPHSTTEALEGQKVRNAAGRVVGRIEGGWLVKRGLDPGRHQLRKPPAWATDAAHLRLPVKGLKLICVDGSVWLGTWGAFERHGFRVNRGYGEQVALPLKWWIVRRRRGKKAARQLRLF